MHIGSLIPSGFLADLARCWSLVSSPRQAHTLSHGNLEYLWLMHQSKYLQLALH